MSCFTAGETVNLEKILKDLICRTAILGFTQEALCGLRQETSPRDLLRTPCTSPSTPHNLQTTLSTQNWNNANQLSAGRTRGSASKKVPPEVPKRTSSITSRSMDGPRHNGLSKSVENGSLSSVQSSGSDSTNCESSEGDPQRGSPVWKNKGLVSTAHSSLPADYLLSLIALAVSRVFF